METGIFSYSYTSSRSRFGSARFGWVWFASLCFVSWRSFAGFASRAFSRPQSLAPHRPPNHLQYGKLTDWQTDGPTARQPLPAVKAKKEKQQPTLAVNHFESSDKCPMNRTLGSNRKHTAQSRSQSRQNRQEPEPEPQPGQ